MNRKWKYPRLLLATALVALASVSRAATNDECTGPSSECVPVGGWNFSISIGAGVRTDPVVHQSTIPLVVIPHISYYGKHFFLDDLDLGYSFIDSDRTNLSLVTSPGYDRVYFYRSDLQNIFVTGFTNFSSAGNPGGNTAVPPGSDGNTNVPAKKPFPWHTRSITYLAGPEWTFKFHGLSGQLDVLHEITGHNHGNEIRAALGIPLSKKSEDWIVDVGLTWKSSAIVNYYYGAPGAYQAGGALDPFVKLGYSHPLKGKWKITGFVECERLSNAIADSPIVNARFVTTAFVGVGYSF
jgi:outer membrane protein